MISANRVEWSVGIVSAAIVLAMIGFILYEALFIRPGMPALEVIVERIAPISGGSRAEFRVVNDGNATAASVEIRGDLKHGGETVESSSVTVDYVPANSERKGGLFFSHDARQYRLEMRALGYTRP